MGVCEGVNVYVCDECEWGMCSWPGHVLPSYPAIPVCLRPSPPLSLTLRSFWGVRVC